MMLHPFQPSPPAHSPPLASKTAQPKLRIGPVDDPLEREADRVEEAVISDKPVGVISNASPSVARRTCADCAEEDAQVLRRKPATQAAMPQYAADGAALAVATGGSPLTRQQREYFEPRLGRDLSAVRVHAHAHSFRASQSINARAYTLGNNIGFAAGEYNPDSAGGRRLLAHELAHVAQGDTQALHRDPKPGVEDKAKTADLGAPYRLELANPLSDVEAHASTYELLPFLMSQLSKRWNIDEKLSWRLFEWTTASLGLMTVLTYSHEQGHGGSARRFGGSPDVDLNAPWSGVTQYNVPNITPDQKLNVSAAGVNQESINASRMVSRWALRHSISYQEAMAYLYAQTNLAAYAARTFALSIRAGGKDDIANYAASQGSLSVGELLALAAMADLLSGPAWAALLGQWNYLRYGERQVNIPSWAIGSDLRLTLPNFQVLVGAKGPLLGGRSTLLVNDRIAIELSVDTRFGTSGLAVGGQLHAQLTPSLTLSPFARLSYGSGEGTGGVLGLEARYRLGPVGLSATLSYRKDDILSEPENASEGLQGRAALTLKF
jgi:Domain of unknown function (DUF4157)